MSAVTRLIPPANSLHISEVTVEAVDHIGNATSTQIRETADKVEAEAKVIADKLRKVADAFDEHARIASEKVSEFCLKMATARNMVCGLETQISDKVNAP